MKSLIIFFPFMFIHLFGYAQGLPVIPCKVNEEYNQKFSKSVQLQEAMNQLVKAGVPGISIALYNDEGWWTGAAGYASIEDKTPMLPCHMIYLQSISKTYMAVAILKLMEEGKITLDDPITTYLPKQTSAMITDAEKITVKMLLNHSSGIPEYNSAPAYVTKLLQEPDHNFEPIDYIRYIDKKPLTFAPGSKYSYRNTNYVLLALIADELTGNHAHYISEHIFKPLNLNHTYYRAETNYLIYPELVNSYWDRNSNGIIENVSVLQRNNVLALVGDDGIVCTTTDAVKFLRGLMEGRLLKSETLDVMKTWVTDVNGNPTYGLGLDYADFLGHTGFGHSGGGIGAGCQLYYFPDYKLYFFAAINLGTVTDSPIHKEAGPILNRIYSILFD